MIETCCCYWEGYRGRNGFDINQASQAIDRFCHNLLNNSQPGAYMAVMPSPDPRTRADPTFPEHVYYFEYPGKYYNVAVRFADQVEAPADYDPFPEHAACNGHTPLPFLVKDHQADCMQMVAALKSCKCSSYFSVYPSPQTPLS